VFAGYAVSIDASLFPVHFFDSGMFCEKCGQLTKFKIFSQEAYNKLYSKNEIPPNKPLFCKCKECGEPVIYATNEFAELQEDPSFGLCKIWGRGPLTAGDLVFIETENVCAVESVNRVLGSPFTQVTLKKLNNEKFEVQADFFDKSEPNANTFYRIIPQDAQNTRVGDMVYYPERKLAGKAIGLRFNGCQRIIVKFDDRQIVEVNAHSNVHYLTDEVLEQNAKWRCSDLPYAQHVQIISNSKVLIVDCTLPNLKAIRELENVVLSIPQVRCFIMHIGMRKSNINSKEIYRELIRNCVCIYNCGVELKNQEVYITGFYSDKNVPKNVYNILSRMPVKKISLSIKKRSDIKNCKTINDNHNFIRISKIGEKTHIDGWISSERERRKAKIQAFFSTFSFKIEDHLQVFNEL